MSFTLARGACLCGLVVFTCHLPAKAGLLEGLEDRSLCNQHWEGAIGLMPSHGPAYLGASDYGAGVKPALFLRYGQTRSPSSPWASASTPGWPGASDQPRGHRLAGHRRENQWAASQAPASTTSR
jgi:hypothetical protein